MIGDVRALVEDLGELGGPQTPCQWINLIGVKVVIFSIDVAFGEFFGKSGVALSTCLECDEV